MDKWAVWCGDDRETEPDAWVRMLKDGDRDWTNKAKRTLFTSREQAQEMLDEIRETFSPDGWNSGIVRIKSKRSNLREFIEETMSMERKDLESCIEDKEWGDAVQAQDWVNCLEYILANGPKC